MSLFSLNSYQSYKEVKASIQGINCAKINTVKLSGYATPIAVKESQSSRLLNGKKQEMLICQIGFLQE